jgi:hypothetical protein
MCDTRTTSTRPRPTAAPRRLGLYLAVALTAIAILVVDVAAAIGAGKRLLECGLTVGGFGTIALWVRHNRVALDLEPWCDCANASVTVREIRPPAPEPAATDGGLRRVTAASLDEVASGDYSAARR